MYEAFVINEAVASCCGVPVANCTCDGQHQQNHNAEEPLREIDWNKFYGQPPSEPSFVLNDCVAEGSDGPAPMPEVVWNFDEPSDVDESQVVDNRNANTPMPEADWQGVFNNQVA